MEYVGREAQRGAAGAAESLKNLLQDLVGAVGGPQVGFVEAMAKVFRQGLAEIGELPVRVAVEACGGLRHGGADGGAYIRGYAMGVLVDVQQNGDVQLGCPVGRQPAKVTAEG
ncbi:hypothetical protein QF050_003378 [Arthrobacter sp. SLBN-112]|nr:hypothetical protein [Arthrobacter sp. SLBN-112]